MGNEEIIALMQARGIKPTANRILILRELHNSDFPLSLGDLETRLKTIDKSNIFRALTLFRNAHLLHVIEDGSDSVKYEICQGHGHCTTDDLHVHFHCESCGQTICLEETHIPLVILPEGYTMTTVNYVIKGLCPKCSEKESSES